MGTKAPLEEQSADARTALNADERWQLVQRIVESKGFERASQLRKILLYVSRSAIEDPTRILREYDIACDVLERRKDFDPGSDNIVRSQFSHLRRKLESYFLEEGRTESLTVKIPKGSYLPHFSPAKVLLEPRAANPALPEKHIEHDEHDLALEVPPLPPESGHWWGSKLALVAGLCLLPSVVLAPLLGWQMSLKRFAPEPATTGNAFVQFLSRSEGQVSVVLPDISLVILENFIGIEDVPVSDYVGGTYLQRLSEVKDETLRMRLAAIGVSRFTTYNESMAASDLIAAMTRLGVSAKPRFARDLHVGDLSEGNTVLIGGPGSNPWASLFSDQLNFRFVDERKSDSYYFDNRNPQSGEQAKYLVTYPERGGQQAIGYVNVAMTPNPAHTGYTLLFIGADQQEAESAVRFLLRGKLSPEIASLLSRKDIRHFEIFLRGTHIVGEADSTFEVVAVRSN